MNETEKQDKKMKILFNDLDIETDKNNINDVDKSIDSEKDSNNEEIRIFR